MRTPSSALPAPPHGLVLARGRPFFATAAAGRLARSLTIFLADFFAAALDFFRAFVGILFSVALQSFRRSSEARQPGIHIHQCGYGFRARGLAPAPRNDWRHLYI